MAIFGNKKKQQQQQAQQQAQSDANTGSPSSDAPKNRDASGSRDGLPASASNVAQSGSTHGSGQGSLSMTQGIPQGPGAGPGPGPSMGSNFGPGSVLPNSGSAVPGAAGGPPGAASGFKFGGPAPRQDMGSSGIPVPGSAGMNPGSSMQGQPGAMRSRKMSEDSVGSHGGYGLAGMGSAMGMGPPGQQSGISGLPPSSGPGSGMPLSGGPGGQPSGPDRPRTQQVVYPWSQRRLTMNPPRFLDETRQAPPGALSPSPFPRYGHAANQVASPTGEVYLFGGLVRESVKNDLYTVYVDQILNPPSTAPPGAPPGSVNLGGGVSATLVQTTGEIPPPRVGHATVLVSNVLILWGGDTKVRADDKQDEGLYLLNLSESRVPPSSCPPAISSDYFLPSSRRHPRMDPREEQLRRA